MAQKWIQAVTSAWTATVSVASIFLLARSAQLAHIDGTVTGSAFIAIAAIGTGHGVYKLVKSG